MGPSDSLWKLHYLCDSVLVIQKPMSKRKPKPAVEVVDVASDPLVDALSLEQADNDFALAPSTATEEGEGEPADETPGHEHCHTPETCPAEALGFIKRRVDVKLTPALAEKLKRLTLRLSLDGRSVAGRQIAKASDALLFLLEQA